MRTYTILELTRDEVNRHIPYPVVCEAHESGVWNTGRRKRLWNEEFTAEEQAACERLFRLAKSWTLVKGVPDSVRLTTKNLILWQKLGRFCASL